MDIALQFQELDDLIVKQTTPPATPILRAKLQTVLEHVEAHVAAKEKVAANAANLQAENAQLNDKLSKSHGEIAALKAKLEQPSQGRLEQESWQSLQYFFDNDQVITVTELSGFLRLSRSIAKHHCDALLSRGLISTAQIPNTDPRFEGIGDNSGFIITPKGRERIILRDR